MRGRGELGRPRGEVAAGYDRLSAVYGVLAEPWERRPRHLALRLLDVKPGERVLEIGIGAGADLKALAHRAGRAFGADLSLGMLRRVSRSTRRASRADCLLVRADALVLPIRSKCFDAVYASFTLELFDPREIPLVLGEVRRVLGRGGRLGLVSLSLLGGGQFTRWYTRAHERWPQWIDCRPILAAEAVEAAGLVIRHSRCERMWGLPVEIVVAQNPV